MARRKKARVKENIYVMVIGVLLIIAMYAAVSPRVSHNFEFPSRETPQPRPEIRQFYHVHADFLVIVNGQKVDFNRPEFDQVNPAMHLHIPNFQGDRVIHIESRNVNLGDFFASLGMIFNRTCFVADGNQYCNASNKTLKIFISGIANNEFGSYRPQDLDRILITYGSESSFTISEQIESVTALACVFSGKCEPPPEAADKIFYN